EPANPRPGFHEKDRVENELHAQVCSGRITLSEAQRAVTANWLELWVRGVAAPADSVGDSQADFAADTAATAIAASMLALVDASAHVPPLVGPTPIEVLPAPRTSTPAPLSVTPSPTAAAVIPAGATAKCVDGTFSFSQTRSGTYSRHGGVAQW